ncbi:hypothetical protein HQ563_17285 [bacterium]|nr:hypothetical protein [bacterium]
MKKCFFAGIAGALFLLAGCEEKEFDSRLVEVAVNQKKQEDNISKIATRIEGVDKRLEEIEQSIEKLPSASGTTPPAESSEGEAAEPLVVEFKDTPEYKQIVAQLSTIQQRLSVTTSNLAETQGNVAMQRQQAQLRNPAEAMQAMSNPQQLNERLDLLHQNFGQKIEDPVKRQQFEADLNQFKRNLAENFSPAQLQQQVLDDLTRRLDSEESDRARERIEREIASMETASGDELAGRLERYQRMQTFRQIRDLTQTYDIPRNTLRDSGLPAMGGGPGERGGPRERGDARGRRGR